MKKYLFFQIICLLAAFDIKSQDIECIGNTIEIPLTGYKNGAIQWQFSSNGTDWSDLSSQNGIKLMYVVTQTGYFRAKVSTGSCDYFSDNTYIQTFAAPTSATAGKDTAISDGSSSAVLNGNIPIAGNGKWTVLSGTGGSFSDSTSPNSIFTGVQGNKYTLKWTVSTDCASSLDYVNISIYNPSRMMTDCEGNLYNTVIIDTQEWMSENLKTAKYCNGEPIGTTTLDISAENLQKYQWAYENDEANVPLYGRLYTWFALNDSRKICPTGWHLPLDSEWSALTNFLGGMTVAGGKLKETGASHWVDMNIDATNEVGFTALPAGYRDPDGTFYGIEDDADWWTGTQSDTYNAFDRSVSNMSGEVSKGFFDKGYGFSVRCVKDK